MPVDDAIPSYVERLRAAAKESGLKRGRDDEVLTADDVASWLQVPKSRVYQAARDKEIPSIPLGKYVRFRRGDVEAFIRGGSA